MSQRSLESLESGEVASIYSVIGTQMARRLTELGFVPQATVEMIRSGNPCIVSIERSRLSLGAPLQRDVILTE